MPNLYEDESGVIRASVDGLGHDLELSILIGGWATFVRVGGEISLDIYLPYESQLGCTLRLKITGPVRARPRLTRSRLKSRRLTILESPSLDRVERLPGDAVLRTESRHRPPAEHPAVSDQHGQLFDARFIQPQGALSAAVIGRESYQAFQPHVCRRVLGCPRGPSRTCSNSDDA